MGAHTDIHLGTTLMLLDNENEDFEVDYEKENDYDVEENDDAHSEPSDEECKAFFIILQQPQFTGRSLHDGKKKFYS